MTEQEAIERITVALATQSIPLPTTFERQAWIAWNEIKAIAREDALTVKLPPAQDAPGLAITAYNRDGMSLTT